MALNNFKCNHLMPLHFKWLTQANCYTKSPKNDTFELTHLQVLHTSPCHKQFGSA